jgi:DNA-binding PadR family transcriptional regulator
MSPVFRHGRLRLYLLKLLDEAPRHGYEIIRLLQDRFLGVYAPSPGTIYPRLARLEEEGLVTHDDADGRKVYRITEKGREELASRLDDLAELEDSITASVRDIAREVSEDVRETVRSLREELASAVRDVHAGSPSRKRQPARDASDRQRAGSAGDRLDGERERLDAERERLEAERTAAQERLDAEWGAAQERLDAAQERLDAERDAAQERLDAEHEHLGAEDERLAATAEAPEAGSGRRGGGEKAAPGAGDHRAHGRESRAGRGRHWGHGGSDWGDWAGRAGWAGQAKWADPHAYRDLERVAKQFTRDLRTAAWQAQAVSEDAVQELRVILDDAIGRIKDDVFGGGKSPAGGPGDDESSSPGTHGQEQRAGE